ncbi:PEP-CTERM sorting domain-containing protein [Phycisphaerales bacterium AB-hyl4]|uniref:PEP-CTERM sorting domain-containing protein n=1 Tax=Natronomicrosphaera hydrolytica TaxID=3242702 RepID=A0ABV4U6C1_9BACT
MQRIQASIRRRFATLAGVALMVGLPAGVAHGQSLHEGDIGLIEHNGHIVTGQVVDEETVVIQRVFDRYFGADGFPNVVDVGYNSLPGAFAPSSAIGFNFRESLRLWEGEANGFRTLDAITEETQSVSYGPASATSGDGFAEGFTVNVAANGEFHRHYWYGLDNPIHGSQAIYLLELELYSTDNALADTYRSKFGEYGTSDPFWILIGHHGVVDQAEMAIAFNYVQTHIVPEPGSVALLAAGVGFMLIRRGRKNAKGGAPAFQQTQFSQPDLKH